MKQSKKIEDFVIVIIVGTLLLIVNSCKQETLYSDSEPIKDITGHIYKTVKIGTQIWMAENLKTSRLNDGTIIANLPFNQSWSGITGPGYWGSGECMFYNGYSVNTGNLCPTGWHVPTQDDLNTLFTYLGGPSVAGGKMKDVNAFNWPDPDKVATYKSGFSAQACGYRIQEGPAQYLWDGQGSTTAFLAIGGYYRLTNGIAEIQYSAKSDLDYNTFTGNARCMKN
jgi:uncharacterized protein (TIGR02145 family)